MTNEAAERLRSFLNTRFVPGHPENHAADLDEALAAERKATVERMTSVAGLRINADQIRAALKELGPTGDKAEAYVKAAALGMADILDSQAAR